MKYYIIIIIIYIIHTLMEIQFDIVVKVKILPLRFRNERLQRKPRPIGERPKYYFYFRCFCNFTTLCKKIKTKLYF